ncbi:MAG: MBOAT family protein [Clostridia bacterium]|nr:MBOAT family protein [Clostridia bacterium]
MLFTSYNFIAFLSAVIILYWLIPRKARWVLLLVADMVFYYFSKTTALPVNLIYLVSTIVSTYIFTNLITRNANKEKAYLKANKESLDKETKKKYKEQQKAVRRRLLIGSIVVNIGMLAVVKYTNFTISNINSIMGVLGSAHRLTFVDIAVPMGISYYIFQTVGYSIDCYRGKTEAQKNIFKLALFASFFPQLVQGPISRYDDLAPALFESKEFDFKYISYGLQRILWGFFKKLVIADRLLTAVTTIIKDTETYNGLFVVLGMLFYAIELYCDFTGGIDITIGAAEALGIPLKENFIRPYFSKTLKEFWNRWHITMGTWFTDYIFYPLSVSKFMLNLNRSSRKHLGDKIGKRVPVYTATIIVWFATGIWHGASWNFIVWGLGNCLVLLISQELEPFYRFFHSKTKVNGTRIWDAVRIIRTMLIVSSLRLFDCYRDVPLTFKMFGSIFTDKAVINKETLMGLGLEPTDYIVVLIGVIIVFVVSLIGRSGSVRDKISTIPYWGKFAIWFGLFLIVLIFGQYGIGYAASQFIYNQF